MTDDRMDALLNRAGAQWRDAHSDAAHVDLATVTSARQDEAPLVPIVPPAVRRKRAWLPIAAAAVVIGAIVSTLLLVHGRSSGSGRENVGGTSALVGVDWRLESGRRADGTPLGVVAPASLLFTADKISGNDGCNHFGGNVSFDGARFTATNVASTAMGCLDLHEPGALALVQSVLMAQGAVTWAVDGDHLTLSRTGAGSLVYVAHRAATTTDPKALIGQWELVTTEQGTGPDGTASSVPAGLSNVRFRPDGRFGGKDDCNEFGGTADYGQGTLRSHGFGGTLVLCAAGPAALVDKVFVAGNLTWSITDGQLTITRPGVGALVYAPSANDQPLPTGSASPTATAVPSGAEGGSPGTK